MTSDEEKLIEACAEWGRAYSRMGECDKAIEDLTRSSDPIVASAALQLWWMREERALGVTAEQARRFVEKKKQAAKTEF